MFLSSLSCALQFEACPGLVPSKSSVFILAYWKALPTASAWNFFFFFFFFGLFRAAHKAYGGSQARGRIGAFATSLYHSHSNTRYEPHLPPIPQLTANAGSLTHWARPWITPASSWMLVRFVSFGPRWEVCRELFLVLVVGRVDGRLWLAEWNEAWSYFALLS